MLNPLSLVTSGKVVAIALAVGVAVGGVGTWRVMSWRETAQQVKVVTKTIEKVKLQPVVTERVVTKYLKARGDSEKHTQDLILEIPTHVTPETDAAYPVPCGFVRVFNGAWHGPLPDPTRCPDGAASDVPLSAVSGAEAVNGGNYDKIANQLTALQDWIREQKALSDK